MNSISFEERVRHLAAVAQAQGYEDLSRAFLDVITRLQFARVHVVTIGEFNRGKSTLVNALVGMPILPMDIVPTTAVLWSIEKGAEVTVSAVHKDGGETSIPAAELSRLSADGDLKPEDHRFVRVTVPHLAVGDDVVIIDTPGVNDINEQRAEVTYGFLRNADAAIFVMDASSPVTKTESEFLQTQVLDASIDKIVFVLNKIDRIDAKEVEESVSAAKERLHEILGRDVPIVALDAARALEMNAEGKLSAAREWGFSALQSELRAMLADARREEDRAALADRRARSLGRALISRIRARMSMAVLKADEREKIRAEFEAEVDQQRERVERFLEHATIHGRERLKAMIALSMREPREELVKNLDVRLSGMKGDFKTFIQKVVPYEVQLLVKRWFEANRPRVEQFLGEFSAFASEEYTKHFGHSFGYTGLFETGVLPRPNAQGGASAEDPNEYVQLALPAVGYLAASFLALGPFAIVGLVAGGIIGKRMRDAQASAIRDRLQLELPMIVEQATTTPVASLQDAADLWFDGFNDSVRARFESDVVGRRRDFDSVATSDVSGSVNDALDEAEALLS